MTNRPNPAKPKDDGSGSDDTAGYTDFHCVIFHELNRSPSNLRVSR
jgi:hypothetical protein